MFVGLPRLRAGWCLTPLAHASPLPLLAAPGCPACSDVPITCSEPPVCDRVGQIIPVTGLCSIATGDFKGTPVTMYDDNQKAVTSITCAGRAARAVQRVGAGTWSLAGMTLEVWDQGPPP